jgi:hypothetical protein
MRPYNTVIRKWQQPCRPFATPPQAFPLSDMAWDGQAEAFPLHLAACAAAVILTWSIGDGGVEGKHKDR